MECSGRDSVRTISGRIVGQPEAIRSCCLAVVPQERVKTGAFRHISGRVAICRSLLAQPAQGGETCRAEALNCRYARQ